MPTPVTGTSGTGAADAAAMAASSSTSSADNTMGKDAFLKLLVTQLKYQDPLKPTDAQSFMAQTAQFTQVEKLEELTKAMAKSSQISSLSTASALLGRTVSFALPTGGTASGVVTGATPATDGVHLRVGSRETTLDQLIEVTETPTGA